MEPTGVTGPTGPTGIIGVTGPTGSSSSSLVNFSASISSLSISNAGQLTNWNTTDPFYSNPNFNAVTGNFTVPTSGKYSVKLTINYNTTAAIIVSLGNGINPAFTVQKTSPTSNILIAGNVPILNVNVALVLTLRTILGSGEVVLVGDVNLSSGDVIGVFYVANGLTISLNLGGVNPPGVIWSMHLL